MRAMVDASTVAAPDLPRLYKESIGCLQAAGSFCTVQLKWQVSVCNGLYS